MTRIIFLIGAFLTTLVIIQLESCNTNTFAQGEILYNNFCSNCHMVDGKGLANLIPPIVHSDYISNEDHQIACIIRYGMEGEITVNGVKYNAEMPGFKELSDFEIANIIKQQHSTTYSFQKLGDRTSNCTDTEFMTNVEQGIHHCQRGDVFQIVFSRAFQQQFKGDEFNVYRALRSINPSPYLFYFDYGSFKLFGSSPEAQLIIQKGKVTIHPIAGTFRRTGDDKRDAELAIALTSDPKENAEHVMLVDLARNDLSRNGKEVEVEVYKEIQYFSHVIHLVSKVTSTFHQNANKIKIIGDTFPAGTLSGAPKYRALQLIDQYEKTPRGFYGGCIGHLDFNGDFNHAIMIRTFKSNKNTLTYQAGAGIVVDSKPENELQEVENKLMALNKAIVLAEEL